ncbi:MAG: glycosyltransferase [Anaerolineae bacterium]|nr:glycosyltransferase [Anaerolineae bacterium]
MPQVSVLIPVYNAGAHLDETLASLASQTHPDFEVLSVDDGSSDDTPAILKDWASRDARFRTLTLPHEGIIPALNAGLEACRGEYIARMDGDDLAHSERLSLQSEYLDEHPEVALVASQVEGFPKGDLREGFRIYIEWLNSVVSDADVRREMYVESPFAHPSVMFRREVVRGLGGYQEHGWAEDYDLWLRMAHAGARFAKLPQALLQWREHPERLTRTDSRYSLENFLRAKAHYLAEGLLKGRDAVIIWGSGMTGRRLSKHLQRADLPLTAFIDIDPKKIGRTRRGLPILAPEGLMPEWNRHANPVLLAAVGARGARQLIRERLIALGLVEGADWWGVA